MEEFLTVEDIQKMLQISKRTAYKLTNVKGFPSVKVGRRILVNKEKFHRWIDKYTGKEIPI